MRFGQMGRRSLIKATGLGALAGLVGARAQAQTEITRLGEGPIWSREYTVKKGETPRPDRTPPGRPRCSWCTVRPIPAARPSISRSRAGPITR